MDIFVTVSFEAESRGTSSPKDFSPFGDFSILFQDVTSRRRSCQSCRLFCQQSSEQMRHNCWPTVAASVWVELVTWLG